MDPACLKDMHSPQQEVGYEVVSTEEPEPPTKRFRHLNKLIQQKWREGVQRMAMDPPGQVEVERYFASVEALVESTDPLL